MSKYSWKIYLNTGLNNISINETIFLETGTLFTWYSYDGGHIKLYPKRCYYFDYSIDLHTSSISRLKTNDSRCFYFSITIDKILKTYFLSYLQYYKTSFDNVENIRAYINNQSYLINKIAVIDCKLILSSLYKISIHQ